jgi:hypothetical protein
MSTIGGTDSKRLHSLSPIRNNAVVRQSYASIGLNTSITSIKGFGTGSSALLNPKKPINSNPNTNSKASIHPGRNAPSVIQSIYMSGNGNNSHNQPSHAPVGPNTPQASKVGRYSSNMRNADQERKAKHNHQPVFQENYFKYYIGPGNNGELVKRVMQKRDWWRETTSFDTMFNFKWQQTIKGYRYERLTLTQPCKQMLNHFENHKEISTKSGLLKNLQLYCEVR